MNSFFYNIWTYILKERRLLYLFFTSIIIGMSSVCCTDIDTSERGANILFRVGKSQLSTTESQITQIEALIFVNNGSGYVYDYSYIPQNIVDNSNIVSFQLIINSDKRPVKIYFIENANNAISNSGITYGETETQVKQKIKYSYSSSGIVTNFPMWGEYEFPSGVSSSISGTSISLNALPALSRIDIKTDLTPDKFNITNIRVYRVNDLIQVAPNNYLGDLGVSQPSIPTNSGKINTLPISVTGNISQMQMYLSESAAPVAADILSKATCIVVGGKYNNSTVDTYYRIDFEPPIANYPKGQILRGHLYTFQITGVSNPGWETPDEAANNTPANIQVEVSDWADNTMDVDLGGNYFMNLSNREITLANTIGSIGTSLIFTNVFDYTLQWCDAAGTPNGTAGTSINDGLFNITASRNIIIVNALQDNPTGNGTRVAYFLINARRSRLVMTIKQSDQ